MARYRIGIDVGGTFTDCAVIDNDTYELIGSLKIPTTHHSENGVADGIIQVVQRCMEKYGVKPEDVAFIAHGTTQATNALLEGDVAKVGIITLGSGLEGAKSKSDTSMGNIPLTNVKKLLSENVYLDTGDAQWKEKVEEAAGELAGKGCTAIVAAEAFSVDKPENERFTAQRIREMGLCSTATNEISKLYGLKVRTRTAVINASIMPKMLEVANMTADSILKAGIQSQLMIMRCDGGVMTIDEVRDRPILTILSGPAAGVAGALMYEKLTDGLFFEVGGTSTDISCVKDGQVMVRYAEVGGHKTYLNSLDVRTVGVGGGSMIQIERGQIADAGPRSAHIAGLPYEVYTDAAEIADPVLKTVKPVDTDPEYAYIECSNGKKYALTLAGAANICGFVPEGDYAHGSVGAARKAWLPLADSMGISVEEAAEKALHFGAVKNSAVAKALMADYEMDPRTTYFVGGGGGASTAIPYLGKMMGHRVRIAKNAPVISTIGVALACVRDMVERTIVNPTENDIIEIRREAELQAIKNGASPESIEISVEIDTKTNRVRATAIGTTELRSKDLMNKHLSEDDLKKIAAENIQCAPEEVDLVENNGYLYAAVYERKVKSFFGLRTKVIPVLRLIDDEGVIRLQREGAQIHKLGYDGWQDRLKKLIEHYRFYDDGGEQLPGVHLVFGKRIINLSGLASVANMLAVANAELASMKADETILVVCLPK